MKLDKKTIMIDMDEVIVVGKLSDYLVNKRKRRRF